MVKNQAYSNVVSVNDKPCLDTVFSELNLDEEKRKRKAKKTTNWYLRSVRTRQKKFIVSLDSVSMQPDPCTPQRPRVTRSSVRRKASTSPIVIADDVSGNLKTRSITDFYWPNKEPFVEDLSRHPKCKKDKVSLPGSLCIYLKQDKAEEYTFPWGSRKIVAGRSFWLPLGCLESATGGWLLDYHLDLWFDLMWEFRPSNADWTFTGTLFLKHILDGLMYDHYSNGVEYPVAWRDVEKVYFPVNEPDKHWCLAELQLRTGVVSFYDTMGCVQGRGNRWWRNMKRILPNQLTMYLNQKGILESKGIRATNYTVTYQYPAVPQQAGLYGDCGVWVCIILYRLCRNQPLEVDDPLETSLAYRERMVEYFWKHKQPVNNV